MPVLLQNSLGIGPVISVSAIDILFRRDNDASSVGIVPNIGLLAKLRLCTFVDTAVGIVDLKLLELISQSSNLGASRNNIGPENSLIFKFTKRKIWREFNSLGNGPSSWLSVIESASSKGSLVISVGIEPERQLKARLRTPSSGDANSVTGMVPWSILLFMIKNTRARSPMDSGSVPDNRLLLTSKDASPGAPTRAEGRVPEMKFSSILIEIMILASNTAGIVPVRALCSQSNTVNAVKRIRSVGIVPVSLFAVKTIERRLTSFEKAAPGIVPVNEFLSNANLRSLLKLPNIVGMVPVKLFLSTMNSSMSAKLPISTGNVPDRAICWQRKFPSDVKQPNAAGNVPFMGLSDNTRERRLNKQPISPGILPVNRLVWRESSSTLVKLPIAVLIVPLKWRFSNSSILINAVSQ